MISCDFFYGAVMYCYIGDIDTDIAVCRVRVVNRRMEDCRVKMSAMFVEITL